MDGSFNGLILVDKLAKLNNSQQSIETLSHWCIFHRKKAKQVVETWERQFYCSHRDQRISFLFLANDILQNSRRKGLEFVTEFWRVLPDALKDVVKNGDELGRNAATRLVDIWEERKVFGSRGQTLKDELLGENSESRSRKTKGVSYTLKAPAGDALAKLISSCEHVYSGQVDEETLFGKCQAAMNSIDEMEKDLGSDFELGGHGESRLAELQEKHGILKECIHHLKLAESSRKTLLSQIRDALNEQEHEIEQIHKRIEVSQSLYDKAGGICQRLLSPNSLPDPHSAAPPGYCPEPATSIEDRVQPTTTGPGQPAALADNPTQTEEEHRKTPATVVAAAKLDASPPPAQALRYAPSLATEKEGHDVKKPKLENGIPPYSPSHPQPPPLLAPHFPLVQLLAPPMLPAALPHLPPPPLPPINMNAAAMQFMPASVPMAGAPFSYGLVPPPSLPPPPSGLPVAGLPPYLGPPIPNPYIGIHPDEGAGLVGRPAAPPTTAPPPMPRQ